MRERSGGVDGAESEAVEQEVMAELRILQDFGRIETTKGSKVDWRLIGGDHNLLANRRGCAPQFPPGKQLRSKRCSPFPLNVVFRWLGYVLEGPLPLI